MRNYRRTKAARGRRSGNQDFWLSFSDLMSVLVLVFILIMFYILYKYVVIADAYQVELDNMKVIQLALESKETELNDAQAQLAVREDELTAAQDELTAAQDELTTAQTELTTAQQELAEQQLMLNLAQEAMDATEEELEKKQAELDDALSVLSDREAELTALEEQLTAQQTTLNSQQTQLEAAQATLDEQEAQLAAAQITLSEQEAQLILAQTTLDEQQAQLEALVGVRSRIIQEMSDSLKANNITAVVDSSTGAIILASDVMFEYGSAELSDEGKDFIDDFLPVYLSVLLSGENVDYVSEIIIEGHTDTTDSYIRNLELSQERAFAVVEYVLEGGNSGLSSKQKAQFRELLTANGRSYSDPIYDERGNVDLSASRRVVFKFRLTDEKMIQQMQQILESSDE